MAVNLQDAIQQVKEANENPSVEIDNLTAATPATQVEETVEEEDDGLFLDVAPQPEVVAEEKKDNTYADLK